MSHVKGHKIGKVVELTRFRNAEDFHLLNEVESYWEALRDGATVPHRRDIDPRGLERALDNIFYIEKLGAGVVRFRLTGRLIEDILGMDPRSLPFVSMFTGPDRDPLRHSILSMLDRPSVLRMRVQTLRQQGQPNIVGGIVLLPLRDDQGVICKALGCMQISPTYDAKQRVFTIRHTSARGLSSHTKRPEKMPPLIEEAFQVFAEDPAQFQHKRPDRVKRPELRIVKS